MRASRWLAVGFVFYPLYRRHLHAPLAATVRAPIVLGPAAALEYRNILVPRRARPRDGGGARRRLSPRHRAARPRRRASRWSRCRSSCRSTRRCREAEAEANELLDYARTIGDSYGVDVIGRLVRDRRAGRAIVREAEQRNSEIIVMGAPRRRRAQAVFGGTTDYVLKHAPCRVHGRRRARCGMNTFFRAGTTVFGLAFVAIGVALLVVTALHGGGFVGFLLGSLFIAAGVGRLYLLRRGS